MVFFGKCITFQKVLNNARIRAMTTSVQANQINIKGQQINFVKVGTGPRTVLCFPGALGTIWSDFKPQIECLDREKFTVVAWDPPGYGGSRPPDRKFSLSFYENDAVTAYDFMKELGYNRFSLLGWSDGGNSSMILAGKFPEAVEKLVVWGSNSFILPKEIEIINNIRDLSKWSDKMKAPLIATYTEKGLQNLWNSWCDTIVHIFENGGDICKDHLSNIKSPTFILHGDKDPMVAPEHPGYLFSNIKMAKLHRFPEGKHNIHLRYSTEFNKLVTEFLLQ